MSTTSVLLAAGNTYASAMSSRSVLSACSVFGSSGCVTARASAASGSGDATERIDRSVRRRTTRAAVIHHNRFDSGLSRPSSLAAPTKLPRDHDLDLERDHDLDLERDNGLGRRRRCRRRRCNFQGRRSAELERLIRLDLERRRRLDVERRRALHGWTTLDILNRSATGQRSGSIVGLERLIQDGDGSFRC